MTPTTLTRNGNGTADTETPEARTHEPGDGAPVNGNGAPAPAVRRLPAADANGTAAAPDDRPTLAVFCYQAPDSPVGRNAARTVAALARREVPVHLFARHDFGDAAGGAAVHAVGDCPGGDLVDSVQEFTRRACNAFLQHFADGLAHVTPLGYEWSAMPALSILRGVKNLSGLVSVDSLERQRSDMSSDLSRRIAAIELAGLREARTVLVQNPAAGEVAKYWVPDCADRLVPARQPFPMDTFDTGIDPGAVKARYQVGPVDPTILYVGDLDARYGPDVLVKALPAVLRHHPQARLVIVGDGPLFWPLRVYTRYLLLEHAVRLPGSVEGRAMCELVQAADVVAVPSRESTPWWPILAAWAARRPVVASHEAARGLLEHEKDSVLCYPSENSFVWGIERVLYDADLGREVGRRGRAKLEQRFGWECVADQVVELMGVAAGKQ
jgi:glycosyltransferase involved in cell wall biosynthesis